MPQIKESIRWTKYTSRYYDTSPNYHPEIRVTDTAAYKQYRESTPNPRYKQIIQDEGNATTPLFAYSQYGHVREGVTRINMSDGTVFYETMQGRNSLGIQTPVILLDKTNTLVNEAVAKATSAAYRRIADFQSPYQGQVFAGELKEVFELIRNPFKKSAQLTDKFIRTLSQDGAYKEIYKASNKGFGSKKVFYDADKAFKKNSKNLAKAAANSHLEFQFAILPLISDIRAMLKLASDIAEKREHETIRAYGKSEKAIESFRTLNGNGGTYGITWSTTEKSTVENIIRCGMTAKFMDTLAITNNQNPWIDAVDDFSQLPVTSWELLPLSFLVDYFVNVQHILQSAVVTQSGIAYTSNSIIRTYEEKATAQAIVANYIPNRHTPTLITPKQLVSGIRSVNRTGTLLGIPPVVFSLPGSNVRYANIAALLTKFIN